MADTKQCPFCESNVGIAEEKCPKCGFDFSQFDEETISNFEKVAAIVERRKAKERKRKEEEMRIQIEAEKTRDPRARRKGFFDSLKGKK